MDDDAIELDEFEIFKSRAYSKKKPSSSAGKRSPSQRKTERRERPLSHGSAHGSSHGSVHGEHEREHHERHASHFESHERHHEHSHERHHDRHSERHTERHSERHHERQAPITEASIEVQDDVIATTPAKEECESLLHTPDTPRELQSSPNPSRRRKPPHDNQYLGLQGLGAGPCRLGRSYSCRPRSNRPHPPAERSASRPRINSLAGSTTEVVRHSSLTSQNALLPNYDEFEIYRVRSFCTNQKGIINRGDSFKIRSPMVRRPLLVSHENLGSSALSEMSGSVAEGMDDKPEDAHPMGAPIIYRVLISGAQGVGKSSLTQQFMTSEYLGNMDYAPGKFNAFIYITLPDLVFRQCYLTLSLLSLCSLHSTDYSLLFMPLHINTFQ